MTQFDAPKFSASARVCVREYMTCWTLRILFVCIPCCAPHSNAFVSVHDPDSWATWFSDLASDIELKMFGPLMMCAAYILKMFRFISRKILLIFFSIHIRWEWREYMQCARWLIGISWSRFCLMIPSHKSFGMITSYSLDREKFSVNCTDANCWIRSMCDYCYSICNKFC